jgi:uncharacterized protein with HEPN domain
MNSEPLRVADYLEHIVAAIERIHRYTKGMDRAQFLADERTQDAVAKNLENIGEAASRIQSVDAELTARYPGIPWGKIYAMRIVLAHKYFKIDPDIVWDTIQNSLPELEIRVQEIRTELRAADSNPPPSGPA